MSILNTKFSKQVNKAPNELEQDVAAYISSSKNQEMDEVIAKDSRMQVWHLLSDLRTGLVSWYDFKEGAEVLEIGAGFGALTGVLCKKCKSVTVTERSLFRAEQIAKRYEDVENLDVYAGDGLDIRFEKKFDYIVLAGLLEIIGRGTADLKVYADYLSKLKSHLKEDGKLLLAVENRMGLKYFCGATETYTNKAFAGINHYKQGGRGYTFTKKELENVVSMAGFAHRKFYYPLPDFKMPQMIYTDGYLPSKNLKERLIPYHKRTDTMVVFEKELYNDVVENGMFTAMANSFFVECALTEDLGKVAYAAVSTDRGRKKSFATVIYDDRTVKKIPLYAEGIANAKALMENIDDLKEYGIPVVEHSQDESGVISQPFITWPTLSNVLKEIIKTDTNRFEQILDEIYGFILRSSKQTDADENELLQYVTEEQKNLDYGPILKKAYMELIPLNCFYDEKEGNFLFFDQEFVRNNYPAGYVMFRAIHYIYCFTDNAEMYYPKQKLIEKYGMTDTWSIYEQEERRFLKEVRRQDLYAQFYTWAKVDYKRVLDNATRLESEEETIANYQVSDKMKKIWAVELHMLDEVDRICKKYNLQYFLVHGSLLGAVRHKGFIPWDDDLDIALKREDYEKFLEAARTELKEPLSIHTAMTDSDNFWGCYARIRNKNTTAIAAHNLSHSGNKGIWIDVLPLDVCTADEELFRKKEKQIKKYYALLYAKVYGNERNYTFDKNALAWKWCCLKARFSSHEKLARKLDGAMKLYTDKPSEELAYFTGYQKFRRLSAKDFAESKELIFEKRKVPVPCNYESHLFATLGGDYMKYPPKEERKPKHVGIWDPFKPYLEYEKMLGNMFEDIKGKDIILWGSGLMFEDYMQKYGAKYRPAFLVDNDSNKWERHRMGIEICNPKKLLELPKDKYKLIICSYYYKEISKQLEEMGVHNYKVYVQNENWIIEAENKN